MHSGRCVPSVRSRPDPSVCRMQVRVTCEHFFGQPITGAREQIVQGFQCVRVTEGGSWEAINIKLYTFSEILTLEPLEEAARGMKSCAHSTTPPAAWNIHSFNIDIMNDDSQATLLPQQRHFGTLPLPANFMNECRSKLVVFYT